MMVYSYNDAANVIWSLGFVWNLGIDPTVDGISSPTRLWQSLTKWKEKKIKYGKQGIPELHGGSCLGKSLTKWKKIIQPWSFLIGKRLGFAQNWLMKSLLDGDILWKHLLCQGWVKVKDKPSEPQMWVFVPWIMAKKYDFLHNKQTKEVRSW